MTDRHTQVDPPGWKPSVGDVIETGPPDNPDRHFFITVANRLGPTDSLVTRCEAQDFAGITWHFDDPHRSSRDYIRVVPPSEQTRYERVVVAQLTFDDTDLKIAEADGVDAYVMDTMEGRMLAELLNDDWHDANDWPSSMPELIEWVAAHVDQRQAAARGAAARVASVITESADDASRRIFAAAESAVAEIRNGAEPV